VEGLLTPDSLLYFGNKALRLVLILAGAVFACRFLGVVVERFFATNNGVNKLYLEEKRAKTLSNLLKMILRYTVYFISTIMILQEFHIDTTSILAGAGIIGLAVGVGAQSIFKDIIAGFFIFLENQYAVGDYIVSGDMAGTVEDIAFRTTKLRDGSGVLHIIPNGMISRISNYSRGQMLAVINVSVANQADISEVLTLLEKAGREIRQEMPEVLADPTVVGIVDFRPGEIVLQVSAPTLSLEQQKVETAFRRKIKVLFDAAQIPLPMDLWSHRPKEREEKA